VSHPREAALDSSLFVQLTNIAALAAAKTLGLQITVDEFLQKMRRVLLRKGDEIKPENWAILGRLAAEHSRTVPIVDFMFVLVFPLMVTMIRHGSLTFKPKERKASQRRAPEKLAQQSQPKEV